MWKAIKWGLGIMLGIFMAYVLFWGVVFGGLLFLFSGAA